MRVSNLRTVEKKVLGAMLINSNEEMIVQGNLGTLADTMGYKAVGGAITFAIQALELKNYIAKQNDKYKVLL